MGAIAGAFIGFLGSVMSEGQIGFVAGFASFMVLKGLIYFIRKTDPLRESKRGTSR